MLPLSSVSIRSERPTDRLFLFLPLLSVLLFFVSCLLSLPSFLDPSSPPLSHHSPCFFYPSFQLYLGIVLFLPAVTLGPCNGERAFFISSPSLLLPAYKGQRQQNKEKKERKEKEALFSLSLSLSHSLKPWMNVFFFPPSITMLSFLLLSLTSALFPPSSFLFLPFFFSPARFSQIYVGSSVMSPFFSSSIPPPSSIPRWPENTDCCRRSFFIPLFEAKDEGQKG